MDELSKHLQRLNWSVRETKYRPAFGKVTYRNHVDNPSASVVIISWRYVEGFQKNMALLNASRDGSFEVIFVNNGRDDAEFAPVLPHVDTYVNLNYNTGAYVARNIGSLFARAPVIIFLEDDGIIEEGFVKAHLEAYEKYTAISVRGVCRPLTDNPVNKLARHYYLGSKAFPTIANLEGNSSYRAEAFYQAGGWSDEITFGHGGPELSYRLTRVYPDQRMQIYYPVPVIYHDYAKDEEHLRNKKIKQQSSYEALRQKYPDWEQFFLSWRKYHRKRYLLRKKQRSSLPELAADAIDYALYDIVRPIYRLVFKGRFAAVSDREKCDSKPKNASNPAMHSPETTDVLKPEKVE